MSGMDVDGGRKVSVPCATLRTLLQRHGVERVDILKMDIEGAEHAVLASDTSILDQVRSLVIEVHGEQAQRDETIALIAASGFDINLDRDPRADVVVAHNRSLIAGHASREPTHRPSR